MTFMESFSSLHSTSQVSFLPFRQINLIPHSVLEREVKGPVQDLMPEVACQLLIISKSSFFNLQSRSRGRWPCVTPVPEMITVVNLRVRLAIGVSSGFLKG